MRCRYRGAGWEKIRMTEVIKPCSREQPERRFVRIGFYLLLAAYKPFPPPPVLYLRPASNTSLRSTCGRGGGAILVVPILGFPLSITGDTKTNCKVFEKAGSLYI